MRCLCSGSMVKLVSLLVVITHVFRCKNEGKTATAGSVEFVVRVSERRAVPSWVHPLYRLWLMHGVH